MKKVMALILVAALLCPLAGCGDPEEAAIWVVTEETTWDRMNGQAEAVKTAFEEANPGVKVRLDILPVGEQERSAYLQKLRTQIMQGGGPDAYLLPTDDQLVIGDGSNRTFPKVEPLFADVALAMENGMFRDVSQWYDADTELGKESLNAAVMDAGVLEGRRYVLPLRYDIPVIYAQTQALEEVGFDMSSLEKPLPELVQALADTGNAIVAAGGTYGGSGAFANWIDYTSGQVTLTEEALTAYMERYRKTLAAAGECGEATRIDLRNYIYGSYDSFPGVTVAAMEMNRSYAIRYPLYIGSMAQLLDYAPVAQYEEAEYTVLPLQAEGGGTVATVTYYAAMGSGCRDPELTYEFLRQFLLEESQWELNRPAKMNILVGMPPRKATQDASKKTQYPGLIESGWPVRTEGSLAPLWEVRRKQIYSALEVGKYRQRMRKIGLSALEDHWAEILEAPVQQVRFPSVVDDALEEALDSLNDPVDQQPTDLSAQSVARKLLWSMRRHVSEG